MIEKNETEAEFEARMIAQFNAKVNADSVTESSSSATQDAPTIEAIENSQKKPIHSTDSAIKRSETGGPKGLEPTRYGDWEAKGRCHDF